MVHGKKINVAVLCGGPSNERGVSLKSGEQILHALPRSRYKPFLVEITKDGRWQLKNGERQKLAATAKKNATALVPTRENVRKFDVAFIGMHGKFGEDGRVQAALELLGIPYTGSGVLASALGMNKMKTLEIASRYGVRVPKFFYLAGQPAKRQLKTFPGVIAGRVGYPCVVKPNESGSSIGISIVHGKTELPAALKKAFAEDSAVLIEEFIAGIELTCGVMGNSGQTGLFALPPVEIVPPDGRFFDYDAKYFSPKTQEICPARISKRAAKTIQELAKKTHFVLGCDGLTRSDFILSPRGKFYFLEINTIPGLTEASLCPKEARVAGMSFGEFLDRQVRLALLKTRRSNNKF